MKFVNEYWDAISPSEFLQYAKWFTKNVSWGPDALTLEHFALKKGVTRSGNNLLLGQHSAVRKEEAKIEFYPDSFFGSFPIYSELAGRGNG
ncbi:PDxFFG protein, partial [Mesomycoplasma ovipneumoniae]